MAIQLKGITQVSVAKHFGVKPPSVSDWIKRGTVDKAKLPEIWRFFSDVTTPHHWGLESWPWLDQDHNLGACATGSRKTLAERYSRADEATRLLIDIALSNPEEPLPAGLSPSLKVMVDMARAAIQGELGK